MGAEPAVAVSWLTAFLDYPDAVHERGVAFWSAVTGYPLSPVRGRAGEFATLVPPDGDDYLRLQRVGGPGPRIHLDLHVAELEGPAEVLGWLGARRVAGPEDDVLVFATPGGLTCCLVRDPASRVAPSPRTHQSGRRSMVYQVCLTSGPPTVRRRWPTTWRSVPRSSARRSSGPCFATPAGCATASPTGTLAPDALAEPDVETSTSAGSVQKSVRSA